MKKINTGRTSVRPTRQRILDAALVLFNERGPDHVTTAEIARAVEINEGNLYYHFRTKEALFLALFARFEADALAIVGKIDGADEAAAATYAGFLRLWFSLVWDYRFLFRDLVGLISSAPALVEPVRTISAAMRLAVGDIVARMEKAGLAVIPEEERSAVLTNLWIVSTYWAAYLNLQEGITEFGSQQLDWGLEQISSLFRPYLSPEAKAELEAMLVVEP
ncbi:TetR/AcrR family transcriptional regulator [Agrobacterium radiobacter]|jgi:AcrR family transcriptional regulator|uniref:TetR/AcrR family transcriptional regulator n=2 Tax=Agrobacterium tumefaciens TaxID=358 RepID=A0AAP9E2Q2_AGRTU|nr:MULTISPECIES: TetR/AcrR family transcriptional regulator [Agrobacterium tumefaciens complex]AYM05390.1 TetR family transcriptional regulator [Agrobacterium tumefaciens]KWT81530.1 TetR family transcriptional regulator [Agrobacterium tumefaciens str. B6]MBB4405840.1 AcrR family transcriptional regulator [Agrobacterium radiobacter]MBB4450752.1 AcrR family transcriptional regulator [Agrobacterium radiobacter]MBP2506640.1 AcrR family transcriptional regulator [Agrobacterium tumefaciens]